MKEIWKDIENYEGYYQISNLGRVKSLMRTSCIGRTLSERLLKLNKISSVGYKLGITVYLMVELN
jgi:hypothetical protein